MPNIIITTHDTGRHFGCYGVETAHTPAIDAIAEDGFKFTRYFTTSPVCSPSRGAMLTGRYPQSNGLIGLTHSPWHWRFNEGERHLSHILRDAGYHTALFGLQHDGKRWRITATRNGRPDRQRIDGVGEMVVFRHCRRAKRDDPMSHPIF